MSCLI